MTEERLIIVDGREYLVNGCTCVPNGDWGAACDKHDVRYSIGGGFIARFRADVLLWWDIWSIGRAKGWIGCFTHFWVGLGYFLGVTVFGWWFWCWWFGCDPHQQSPETKPMDMGQAKPPGATGEDLFKE